MERTSTVSPGTIRVMWMIAAVIAAAAIALHVWNGARKGEFDWNVLNPAGVLLLSIAGLLGPERPVAYRLLMAAAVISIAVGLVLLLI